ncbi:MAG: type III secretion system translocon subunit SctE [Rhodospirillaceae bacterium]
MTNIDSVGATWQTNRAVATGEVDTAHRIQPSSNQTLPPQTDGLKTGESVYRPGLVVPTMDGTDLTAMLLDLRVKLGNEQTKASSHEVLANQDTMKSVNDERAKKLEEFVAKMEESKNAGLFEKIFSWISSVAMIVVGVVLCATGVGAGAGVAMIVGGVLGVAMQILQETGAMDVITKALGGVFEKMFIAFGMDPAKAKEVGKVVAGIAIAALVIAAQLIIVVASAGTGAASAVAATARSVANIARIVGSGASAVTGLGSGAAQVASSTLGYQASMTQADAVDKQREAAHLQTLLEDELSRLDGLIRKTDKAAQTIVEMMSSTTDSRAVISRNMA